MSYQRDLLRRSLRERVQKDTGAYRGARPSTLAELRLFGLETELFNEPEDLTDVEEIQGAGGGFAFMWDVSVLDGPDPLL